MWRRPQQKINTAREAASGGSGGDLESSSAMGVLEQASKEKAGGGASDASSPSAGLLAKAGSSGAGGLSLLGAEKAGEGGELVLYQQRWIQLALLALLALISDMVCFAVAAAPEVWTEAYGHNPTNLVDLFLVTNVLSCFMVTDLTRALGLRKVVVGASALMAGGCLLRSGAPLVGALPPYPLVLAGTVLVGAAQPFFQCTPPLLSATWFGPKERALATAVAINFNQVGIGSAFLLGGALGTTPAGLNTYFGAIALVSVALCGATLLKFEERPPSPPSKSAAAALDLQAAAAKEGGQLGGSAKEGGLSGFGNDRLPPFAFTFPREAVDLLRRPGFLMPLAAFVTSIAVTNVVSAFTESSLHRAGVDGQLAVDLTGAGFQLAIVVGGIVVGGYVDRTKEFKEVTLACLSATLGLLVFLGLAFGFDLDLPHYLVIGALLGLGLAAGPVQPINAELAVEVSYPADETSIEAVQQLCGNLFSALLVPLCELAARSDYTILPGIGPNEDMRGDSVALVLLTLLCTAYFTTFNAPLKRSEFDGEH